uniref:DUF4258 domain-containing protein n=1 Tax=Candidatus Kentrum sp. UNK TaxID=2126344 RepID=A0A451B392_9GAMM|nr:MAG: hypothetical protein BECKUNK1418G_GA0071005_11475 [Candidatus Kentron sp. UNK]VFK72745.1 MAG: hypothetical protein BECKUNK1418H_GA0071006_11365 [Candidatus Kentron sp. UNK]
MRWNWSLKWKRGIAVEIKFSRHAKQRARLYGIPASTVQDILQEMDLPTGEHEIVKSVPGFAYPLKIVVSAKNQTFTVITNYPFKKGKKHESTIR